MFFFDGSGGKYEEAVDALEKLVEEIDPRQDFKVRHNVALARFAAGLDTPGKMQLALQQILRTQMQENDKKPTLATATAAAGAGDAANGGDAAVGVGLAAHRNLPLNITKVWAEGSGSR